MKVIVLAMALVSAGAYAQTGKELAHETLKKIESLEAMLPAALKVDKADLQRYIVNPANEQAMKWPPLGSNKEADKYARCQFAMADFAVWAEDYWKAKGLLDKTSPSGKSFAMNLKDCRKALK